MSMQSKIILPKRSYFNIAIWSSLFIIYFLLLMDGDGKWGLTIVMTLLLTLLSASTIYRVWLSLIPRYLQKGRSLKFSVALLGWLFFDSFIVLLILNLSLGFYPGMVASDLPGVSSNIVALIVFMWIIVITWSMIIIAKKENEAQLNAATLQKQLAESESQRKELELEQLKAQLQPHFLFNTLNTIYGAAIKKRDDTPEMIMELSSMLDYGLYQASKDRVPLADELAHLERYLNLEKKRFRDGLSVDFEKSGELSNYEIPPLLLMPLVENCIKHGKAMDGVLSIKLKLEMNQDLLTLTTSNTFEPSVTPRGIGLDNLKKRLKNHFPEDHRLHFEENGDTFKAQLKLKLKW